MKQTGTVWFLGVALATALGVSVGDVRAQAARPVAGAPGAVVAPGAPAAPDAAGMLRIRKMPRIGSRDWLQRTPVLTSGPNAKKPREWGVFEVLFDSRPLWIDEVTVSFTLILQSNEAQAPQPYSLFRLTSRYIDVAQGNEHGASAVLLPSALLRYGRPIGLAIEFSVNGQIVASEAVATEAALKDRWWENPAIVDSPKTAKREGYLLERAKTPFGLVNIDDNEVSK